MEQLDLEARMVLGTLEQHPMSICSLEMHWRPTWSTIELERILRKLMQLNRIRLENGRYAVAPKAPQNNH